MRSIIFFAVHRLEKFRYPCAVLEWIGGMSELGLVASGGHVLRVFFGEDRLEIIT